MQDLTGAALRATGKIATTSAWLILLDIAISGEHVRLVNNTENVSFGGDSYSASSFGVSGAEDSNDGSLPKWALVINDTQQQLTDLRENYNGLIGASISMTVVNSKLLAENYIATARSFTVESSKINGDAIALVLGPDSSVLTRYPRYRYMSRHCNAIFKSVECGYVGEEFETCSRTWEQCIERGNANRFNGYIGLQNGTVRFVWA